MIVMITYREDVTEPNEYWQHGLFVNTCYTRLIQLYFVSDREPQ